MAGRRIINDAKLTELYRQGMPLKEIGKELGVSHVAIHKRAKRLNLSRLPEAFKPLTEKERQFCLTVAGGQSRINAVMATYDVVNRNSAKALQHTLMKNPEIRLAIDELMEQKGIGRDFRITKLGEHIQSPDPVVSLKALDMACKIADDAGERTKGTIEGLSFTKFDVSLLDYDE
jgi:hypothetical protein